MVRTTQLLIELLFYVNGYRLVILQLAVMVLLAGFSGHADHDFLRFFSHVTEAIPGHDIVEVFLLLLLNFTLCHLSFFFLKLIINFENENARDAVNVVNYLRAALVNKNGEELLEL